MGYARPTQGDIKRQITLPFTKSVTIAYANLRVRFSRSLVTIGSLMLAVSFLSFVLLKLDIATGLFRHGSEDISRLLTQQGFTLDMHSQEAQSGPKERWIAILSLLVCTVGIINAQLMSVTERFREIGIYKCLGALDGMILRLFLLEAGMMGITGAFTGSLLGLCFAIGNGLLTYGEQSLLCLNVIDAVYSITLAISTGVFLSFLGVLYPALLAARMRPIVALKAEH